MVWVALAQYKSRLLEGEGSLLGCVTWVSPVIVFMWSSTGFLVYSATSSCCLDSSHSIGEPPSGPTPTAQKSLILNSVIPWLQAIKYFIIREILQLSLDRREIQFRCISLPILIDSHKILQGVMPCAWAEKVASTQTFPPTAVVTAL